MNFIHIIVGTLSGICASIGIGGGFILLLYLTVIADTAQKSAQFTNLLFFIPIAILSVIMHAKNHILEKRMILPCSIGGIAGVLIGFFIASKLSNGFISKLFAILILIIGAKELFFSKTSKNKSRR